MGIPPEQSGDIQRQLQGLLAYPRESLDTELKGWLDLSVEEDKANLAQAILAIVNFGGGYILLGFVESEGNWIPSEPRPPDLSGYTQDRANGIVHRYADPPFHCELHHVRHPEHGALFPIVVVPGGHRVPIRAKRDGPNQKHVCQNVYYIRGPGPVSAPIQSAREWDDLIGRCLRAGREDLLEDFRSILFGFGTSLSRTPPEEAARQGLERWIESAMRRLKSLMSERPSTQELYSKGFWIVAYSVIGNFQKPGLADFLEILHRAEGRETGWPAWWVAFRGEIAPYPYDGLIECWMTETRFAGPAHADFWRASPEGLMFLLRGHQEDSEPERREPGTTFHLTLPIWRTGECLLHAERLAASLDASSAHIMFRVTWEGLAGRTLTAWGTDRILFDDRKSRQNSVSSEVFVLADRISATLPEIVVALTKPLYEVFEFFTPGASMVQEELARMRGRSR